MSFWNLVEVYVLASIRRHYGVRLQKVRIALDYVAKNLGNPRPLISQQFFTDGADLFVKRFSQLVSASEHGQVVIREALVGALSRIRRDPDGLASGLYPWLREPDEGRSVEIDPQRAFGRLVVAGTGVPTEALAERWRAGDSIDHLAKDYGLRRDQVEAALRFENQKAA
jgi:uncharacterized protein (DUF433 family)